MLKKEITYEDFDGEMVTHTFYFNLTRTEIIEYTVEYEEGMEQTLQKIIKAEDIRSLVHEFKKIVLFAYGIRDGSMFKKSKEIREEFSQTAAYDALFMELATSDDAASSFIKGIMPKGLAEELAKLPDVIDVPLPPPPAA
jgi:predicted nucleic acid-binding protein